MYPTNIAQFQHHPPNIQKSHTRQIPLTIPASQIFSRTWTKLKFRSAVPIQSFLLTRTYIGSEIYDLENEEGGRKKVQRRDNISMISRDTKHGGGWRAREIEWGEKEGEWAENGGRIKKNEARDDDDLREGWTRPGTNS